MGRGAGVSAPLVAVSMGDPAGIGPEIAVRAAGTIWREAPPSVRLLVVGDASVMRRVAGSIEPGAAIHPIGEVGEARFEAGTLDVLDLDLIDGESVAWGVEEPACGRAAAESLRAAAALALGGDVDAMASAPLHKAAMRKAGYDYPGQTEFLADLTGAERFGMIIVAGTLRLLYVTNHMALREVPDAVTFDAVFDKLILAHETLVGWGVPDPRIGVAALNPHAGEGGMMGTEERDAILPAVEAARKRGIRAEGPFPVDAFLPGAGDGRYPMVLVMYHDQGNITAKMAGQGAVCTQVIGLPIIRTTTAHGTAFDIAGRGIAKPDSMIAAVKVAAGTVRLRTGLTRVASKTL